MKHRRLPILVGPWRSEVGFEALYWLPFLAHVRASLNIPAERFIPITRGGAAHWYDVPIGLELYAMRSPADVRIANREDHERQGILKQIRVTDFDRGIYRDAAKTLGLKRYQTLHPKWMYHTLAPFWQAQRGLNWLGPRIQIQTWAPPPLPGGVTLPDRYIAVRFYARPTFPVSSETAEFARETLKQISQVAPVVLVNPPDDLHADDHLDFSPTSLPPNVLRLSDLCPMTPETNLVIQSAVMARAEAFVGTYGGLAQLALRFGRPVIGLYQDWHSTALAHLQFSQALAMQLRVPFHVLKMADLAMIQAFLPRITLSRPSSRATK